MLPIRLEPRPEALDCEPPESGEGAEPDDEPDLCRRLKCTRSETVSEGPISRSMLSKASSHLRGVTKSVTLVSAVSKDVFHTLQRISLWERYVRKGHLLMWSSLMDAVAARMIANDDENSQ